MDILARELASLHARWAPLETRAAAILSNIRLRCRDRLPGETYNQANERQVRDFIACLREEFPGRTYEVERGGQQDAPQVFARRWDHARHRRDAPCVVIERQKLSPWPMRRTRWNFIFTVPGESPETFLLVAHYDTWRGPGADDNTTGEEILKQYLLADLRSPKRPQLTHVYFLASSEECGLVGMLSQFLLAGGLVAALQALQRGSWFYLAVAVALCPLAGYRFGIAGSREYVRALSPEELRQIMAVISVDSVGEGRMFIPRSTLAVDFLRALVPFGAYDSFTDLLEEAAHLHGIKYNNYLAGGITDHVSFLEVNDGFWARVRDAAGRTWSWLSRGDYQPPRRIPASALVTMLPGKASPLIFGGKIHTRQDVPERVYPEPVRQALLILDYVYHVLEGGTPVLEPRDLDRFHYSRLYAIVDPEERTSEYWLILKDAQEPDRRNLNAVYTVENARIDGDAKEGWVRAGLPLTWGVHTRLRDEVRDLCAKGGREYHRVRLNHLTVSDGQRELVFARKLSLADQFRRRYYRAQAWMSRQAGRYSFWAFLALAWGISEVVTRSLAGAFKLSSAFQSWFLKYEAVTLPVALLLQIGLLAWFIVRLVPAWVDNHYKYENRADNIGSLRRQPPV